MNNEQTCYVLNVRIGIKHNLPEHLHNVLVSSLLCVRTVTDGVSDNFITASPGLEPGATEPESCLILKIVNKMCQHGILFALIIA